jgi:hypothetical protein
MSKGNSNTQELVQRIEQARDALDAALKILGKGAAQSKPAKASKVAAAPMARAGALDFTMPLRAFVKKYAHGLNGAKKFVLLIAYLTKGDTAKAVPLSKIEANWNKMTAKGLLGMKFNRLYTSQARENDWVTTEKMGAYRLRPSWKAAFHG